MDDRARFERLLPGADVRVRSRFDDRWVGGFRVCGFVPTDDGAGVSYRLRRTSDGVELPATFAPGDVEPRHRQSMGASFWPGLPI